MDNLQQANKLPTLGQRYAGRLSLLFSKKEITGKIVTATRGARHLSLGVKLFDPTQLEKALALAEPAALACGVKAILTQRISGLVSYQIELNQGFWEYYTRLDVSGLQLGLGEQRAPVSFDFDPPHTLIAGTTGSGKSETAKSALIALTTSYSPEQLELLIIDPHRDFADFENVAHLGGSIAHSSEDVDKVLAYAATKFLHRETEDIKDSHRVVFVIDEAEGVLTERGRQPLPGMSRLDIVKAIADRGRKFNVNLIVITPKPTEKTLPGFLDKLNNRLVGLVDRAGTSAYLTGHAGVGCHLLTGKGDFIHVTGPLVERFQVAMAQRGDFERLPRAEIKPVEVDTSRLITLPADELLTDKPVGRPPLTVDPRIAARYFWLNPASISISQANELFNLSRGEHNLHKQFALDFIDELQKIRSAK